MVAMAPATKQSSKPVFKTSSPFTETKWPEIAPDHQEVILELLCNLITPLGDYRRTHIHPSKGKKRKRTTKPSPDDSTMAETAPPPPDIGKHLLIGLNSVTRHLEALAAQNAPTTAPVFASKNHHQASEAAKEQSAPKELSERNSSTNKQDSQVEKKGVLRPLSMVILTHPKPALSPAHAHLPTLVHLSILSSGPASTIPTRLIPLPTSTDARLASKLHIPRVGALAIHGGAPGARALEEYVREHVGVTECKWIDEAMTAEWRGLNVAAEVPGGRD
ncbi:hypothetical protein EJ02DRAFT_403606 [Clathrospora elynae]|uniref:Uncharacterized protein n=1 Tax=Clathrospora elynae TaxID=706981 RepID=A0A6A5SQE5_9PLEO|nr:hypothetical protein EJ02DRAFT_403606 [Clathrospora elynae]